MKGVIRNALVAGLLMAGGSAAMAANVGQVRVTDVLGSGPEDR